MNTTFISAALQNMEPQLVKACALWSALRICEHDLPSSHIVAGLSFAIDDLHTGTFASLAALSAADDELCPSGVRSAIYALDLHNFRLHAHHSLTELAKQQGVHFVNAMLSDLMETNTSPLEVAV